MSVRERLADLGFALPPAPKPAGNYCPAVIAHGFLFLSGQFPYASGELKFRGRVGAELTEEEGGAAARLAALNVLAQIDAALGGFERLATLVRVEGYVSSAPGWTDQPRVLDYASDLFGAVLGERGQHTRSALGPRRLPLDASVKLVVTASLVTESGREFRDL